MDSSGEEMEDGVSEVRVVIVDVIWSGWRETG